MKNQEIIARQIDLFTRVNPEYGARVAQASSNKHNLYNVRDKTSLDKLDWFCLLFNAFTLLCIMYIMLTRIE